MRGLLCLPALAVLLTACGSSDVAPRAAVPPTPTASSEGGTGPAAPVPVLGRRDLTGRVDSVDYRLAVPRFSGPDAAEVDRRVRRSVLDTVAGLAAGADGAQASVEGDSEVTVDDGRTVQVRLSYVFFVVGTAHPVDAVSTVVLRRADLHPVPLDEVFDDLDGALEVARRAAARKATSTGRDDPEGLLDDPAAFGDWQTTPDGLVFSFDDGVAGSHASGLRQVDVPWDALRPFVRDEAFALLGPAGAGPSAR